MLVDKKNYIHFKEIHYFIHELNGAKLTVKKIIMFKNIFLFQTNAFFYLFIFFK